VAESVRLVSTSVSGGTFAVIVHLRAIQGTPLVSSQGSSLSRRGAIAGGTLTVRSPAPGDLSARFIHHGAVRGKLTITADADLIALGCCQVPSASTYITTNSRAGTPPLRRSVALSSRSWSVRLYRPRSAPISRSRSLARWSRFEAA
jgi:hypothetical protein